MDSTSFIKVLLVEDADINRQLILMSFQKWPQFKMDEASNGNEAVDKAKTKDYDVILMDMRMPDMDGEEAARIIRGFPEEKYKKVPIIAVTGLTKEELQDSTLFTDVLMKPFGAEELKNKILQHSPLSDTQPFSVAGKA